MSMWRFESSPLWLAARRKVITATDLIDLKSGFTKLTEDQKEGREFAPNFASMYGKKNARVPDDPTSWDSAARGHFLEPYAIEEWNDRDDTQYYHWDDCVIVNGTLGFSPDAMDIPQPDDMPVEMHAGEVKDVHKILEIKCYDIKAHMKAVVTPKEKLDERWQVAAAFMVLPSLEKATIVFYCPKTSIGIMYKEYEREDLQKEMETLYKIWKVWDKQSELIDRFYQNEMTTNFTEEEIEKDFAEYMSTAYRRFE